MRCEGRRRARYVTESSDLRVRRVGETVQNNSKATTRQVHITIAAYNQKSRYTARNSQQNAVTCSKTKRAELLPPSLSRDTRTHRQPYPLAESARHIHRWISPSTCLRVAILQKDPVSLRTSERHAGPRLPCAEPSRVECQDSWRVAWIRRPVFLRTGSPKSQQGKDRRI